MKIQENSVVSIDYTLTSDEGEVLDSSQGGDPLTYIHGIGRTTATRLANELGFPRERRVQELTDAEILLIREKIDRELTVEGDLRRQNAMNIKRLMDLACYRGLRHRKGLPVRGQRTHTNARTRKGKAKPIAGKKK